MNKTDMKYVEEMERERMVKESIIKSIDIIEQEIIIDYKEAKTKSNLYTDMTEKTYISGQMNAYIRVLKYMGYSDDRIKNL